MNTYLSVGKRKRWAQGGLLIVLALAGSGCTATGPGKAGTPSYRSEVAFLRRHTRVIEFKLGCGRIAVTPQLQGRVMTSAFDPDGLSLGWVNRADVAAGEREVNFNNYGGADRLWLGPEGGPFSLFYPQGKPQTDENWQTPAACHIGPFEVVRQDADAVHLRTAMSLLNAAGARFEFQVDRTLRPVSLVEAEAFLKTDLSGDLAYVGFVSENRITNVADHALTAGLGTVSIWTMGMFPGRDGTVVIIPFDRLGEGTEVRTHYFAEPGPDRLVVDTPKGVILFRGDGKFRSKIGLSPGRARDRLGSIDFANRVLTIVHFDLTPGQRKYVNSLREIPQADPFGGDVINAYNHSGKPWGAFYELESSSPVAFLEPGESLAHHHRTLQFHGSIEALSAISEKVLGVGLEHVRRQMP